MDEVDAQVLYGQKVVILPAGGYEVQNIMVSGWILPLLEARRAEESELSSPEVQFH